MPARLSILTAAQACLVSALSSNDCDKDKNTVGGQALVEGVMMRGKEKIAWAVRKPDGEIVVESYPFVSVTKRVKLLGLPVVRGVVGMFESLKWGYKAMTRSADIAIEGVDNDNVGANIVRPPTDTDTAADNTVVADAAVDNSGADNIAVDTTSSTTNGRTSASLGDQVLIALSMLVALSISVGLFMYAPMWIANRIPFIKDTPLYFNLFAGAVRITLLLGYLTAISFWSDIRRVFEYHGAEHKTILAYEDGKPLTFDNIDPYTTIHPRCGTSFLVLLAIVGILMSSIIDTLHIQYIGEYANLFHRFGIRILFIPLLAGVSYEALKLSAKYKNVPLVNILILPGLMVQRITTKKPDESQVAIAVRALEAAV